MRWASCSHSLARASSCFGSRRQDNSVELLGVHVDDMITGGVTAFYQQRIDKLRKAFPFRKWNVGGGEFTGSVLKQDPNDQRDLRQPGGFCFRHGPG